MDLCKSQNAGVVIRGLRVFADFDYEFQLGLANRQLEPNVETCFLLTEAAHIYISSSLVKEIALHKGDTRKYVPTPVAIALEAKFSQGS